MDELAGVNTSDSSRASREIIESPTAAELRGVLFRIAHIMQQDGPCVELTIDYLERFQPSDIERVVREAELEVRLVTGSPEDRNLRGIIPLTIEGFPDGSSKLTIGHGGGPLGLDLHPRDYFNVMTRLRQTAHDVAPDMEIEMRSLPVRRDRYPLESRVRAILDRMVPTPVEIARRRGR